MIDIPFEDDQGGIKKLIGVPVTPEDITFSQFIDFTNSDDQFLQAVRGDHEAAPHVYEAVTKIIGGDVEILPFQNGDEPEDIIDQGYFIQPGDNLSVLRLFAHIWTVITNYEARRRKGLNFQCTYKGDLYFITGNRAIRLFTEDADYRITTGEFIELQEWRRQFNYNMKAGDPAGELAFRLGLTEMAILLRKEGEKLPYWVSKREEFLKERSMHFRELPMTTILDIRFFLIDILAEYLKTPDIASSGKACPKVPRKGIKIYGPMHGRGPTQK